jgi:glycosyltransferase involved in cell wall biosynthesis
MKVLHVEMGRHLYGGARQAAYLLNGLDRFPGKHVLVCAEAGGIVGAIRNPAVAVHPLAMRGDLDLPFIGRLRRIIRRERPDFLHVHSRRGDFLSALAGQLERVPAIHSRRVDNPPRWFDRRCKLALFQRIIAISRGIHDVLLRAGVCEHKLLCIPSAVDTEQYRPGCDMTWFSEQFCAGAERPVIGIIAQLIERKGHKVLFDALPLVLERHPGARLLVFGRGPLGEQLRRYIRALGIEHAVHFSGYRSDMDRIIPCLDLVVHPAWMEGLGVSLLEAAACGVPIIATRVGGIPEIVLDGVNGFLIEPGDSRQLAEAMCRLLDQPETAGAFGQAGRRLALERYSLARMVENNYRAYVSLLQGDGRTLR